MDPSARREEMELVYVTGYNASGKTTLGECLAQAHEGWECIDGDEWVEDPENHELLSLLHNGGGVTTLMRGTFQSDNLVEEIKGHDAEVKAYWEPFFRLLFEKLKQTK
jgi:dephospho-CoA kinase